MWKLTQKYFIEIDDAIEGVKLLKTEDRLLLEYFATTTKLKLVYIEEWRVANIYRLYLNIFTVTNINECSGRVIDNICWHEIRRVGTTNNLYWTLQGNPSKSNWGYWKRVLHKSLYHGENNTLLISLRDWLEESTVTKISYWK